MTVYGYWRCSTTEQDQQRQVLALKQAGCEEILGDKITGTSDWSSRPQLQRCLDLIQAGDTLVISELSRLSRTFYGDGQPGVRSPGKRDPHQNSGWEIGYLCNASRDNDADRFNPGICSISRTRSNQDQNRRRQSGCPSKRSQIWAKENVYIISSRRSCEKAQ